MQLADFDFDLPDNLIARYPLEKRSASKLLLLDELGNISHHKFTNLLDFITAKDLLVFNNTKVLAARLFGHKLSGGKVEILIERITNNTTAIAHVKSSKTCKIGMKIMIEDVQITVLNRQQDLFIIEFSQPVLDVLTQYGHMPLPPYLQRNDEVLDSTRYQTVYAKKAGAVAAPTAGLHFDEQLMAQIKKKDIKTAMVTLHVGSGTFAPVRVDNIDQHKMHSEWCLVDAEVVSKINNCKQNNGRVIAVGTTSARTLESAVVNGKLGEFCGETDIFLYPGKSFQIVDMLLTNFHLPKSTLLMLVSAFAGLSNIKRAYEEAINKKYRFFSYGDAMLIHKINKSI